MKVSMEAKKAEAIKRMKALDLYSPYIKAFEKRGEIFLSEMTGGVYEFSGDAELIAKVKEFERDVNGLVYHVIHSFTQFGDLYSFLYVSDHENEWFMDNADIAEGYAVAYVWNKTDEWCSELGSIMVQSRFGGMVRVG